MTGRSEGEKVFERTVLRRVADQHGVDHETLATVVDEHQASVADLPGVENLVYEWRKQYEAPVIERTPDVYYLTVPDWVWSEFGDHLDLGESTLAALTEVHRQTTVDNSETDADPPSGGAYVVLDRRRDE